MGKLSRARSSRLRPLSPKRRRELQDLVERDICTVSQYELWKERGSGYAAGQYLDEVRDLMCEECKKRTVDSIAGACEKEWLVGSSPDGRVLAWCPDCGANEREEIGRAVKLYRSLN